MLSLQTDELLYEGGEDEIIVRPPTQENGKVRPVRASQDIPQFGGLDTGRRSQTAQS